MKKIRKDLAADFKQWGKRKTERVYRMTKKFGTIFDWYDDGTKG